MTALESHAAGYEISPEQARVARACAGKPAYATLELHLRGAASPERLRDTLAQLAARHEILRTQLCHLPELDRPVQAIGDPPALAQGIELSILPLGELTRI